jgi:hypothetical protein
MSEQEKNDVFAPLHGILRAPADPWLEEKVILRLKRSEDPIEISLGTRRFLSWSLAFIVVINIGVVSYAMRSSAKGISENALSQEFGSDQSIYSY